MKIGGTSLPRRSAVSGCGGTRTSTGLSTSRAALSASTFFITAYSSTSSGNFRPASLTGTAAYFSSNTANFCAAPIILAEAGPVSFFITGPAYFRFH